MWQDLFEKIRFYLSLRLQYKRNAINAEIRIERLRLVKEIS